MRWSIVIALGAATTACSLLVSTSGLEGGGDNADGGGGTPPASPDAPATPPTTPPGADGSTSGGDADSDAAPSDPTLVAYWAFDETSGVVAHDSSGNGHDAMLTGGAHFDDGGAKNNCVRVGGGGDQVAVASLDGPFPTSGTFSIWFRDDVPATGTDDQQLLDGWDKTRAHVFARHVAGEAANVFQVALQPVTTAGDYAYATEFTVTTSTWTHLVVTWDAGAKLGAVYVDGTAVQSSAYLEDFIPTQEVVRFGQSLSGAIDEVRLYSRVLSGAEIASLK